MRSFSLLLLFLFHEVNAFKYLLYNPKSTRSHVLFVNKIADVLVDAGHDVVSYLFKMINIKVHSILGDFHARS